MRRITLLIICYFHLAAFAQVTQLTLNANWQFRKLNDSAWLPATVPGTVHTDLLANKKIADPFVTGSNEKLVWIESSVWEYQTSFLCDNKMLQRQNVELVFEGLDTYARVYINGVLALAADNMFRSWTVDVKKYLAAGQNQIRVEFMPAEAEEKKKAAELSYKLPEGTRVFTRKAQYQYGWDFASRFLTCGIWKNVELLAWDDARFESVQVSSQEIKDTLAILDFTFDINCKTNADYSMRVVPLDKELKGAVAILNTPVAAGKDNYTCGYRIKKPKLWWCNEMGAANLYHFKVELWKGNKLLDSKSLRTGIRSVKLVNQKDSAGESFYFTLNGKPVFMKGANFVPPDIFLPRVKKADLERIVQSAADAHMNMLRVWGGGAYADDEFYNLCDEKGILLWQDFMFACAMYPGDTAFVSNVKHEVVEQVKRLQSHPSLALWCGNNENDEGWKNWGWQKQMNYSKEDSAKIWSDYKNLFEKIIPQIVLDNDPQRAYWSSSPAIGWGRKESLLKGDAHYWGVWWGLEPFEIYAQKVGRFMSEYGFQALPSVHCIKTYHPYPIKPTSAFISTRQKHPKGAETIDAYLKRDFREPNNYEDFTFISQLVQARGLEIAIQAHRRKMPYCMGSLYWQLNDCWPGITWSSLDFTGNWKAAHYAAKRYFDPLLISFEEKNDSVSVYLISDLIKNVSGEMKIELLDFAGKTVWEKKLEVNMAGGSVQKIYSYFPVWLGGYGKELVVLRASLKPKGQPETVSAMYFFASPKDLALKKANISIATVAGGFEISTNTLAKNVFLDAGPGINFSDNYFDLLPGEKKFIKISGKIKKGQKIIARSLADTY